VTHDKDNPIGTLIRLAGERDMPSSAGIERARAAAEAAWRAGLQSVAAERVPPFRRTSAWAIAAGVVALAILGTWYGRASPPVPVARIAAVSADAMLRGPFDGAPEPGTDVLSGAILETTSGRVALAFGTLSLRVDRNSRLRFDAPDLVTLLDGSVYVDSGGVNALAALRITTPAGAVRHLGTQFQVTVNGELTRIQVREGRVAVDGPATREVAAGEKLEVRGGDAVLTRAQPAHGETWEWISQTAPAFDIENRLLPEFLAWIGREHGWQLRYADAASQARVQEVRLHGTLEGLDADGMIERVSLITGTPMILREGVLTVGSAAP
jgi:ferric-dicitrate binding protein FerR (iron transport regulator)